MEREQIERLAMDSAAGELNEDAQGLFEEYLAGHPEAKKYVEDMLGIYEKTDAAIIAKTQYAVKADLNTANISIGSHSRVFRLPIARWAAVVIFAAFVGMTAGRWSKSFVLVEKPGKIAAYRDSAERQQSFGLENTGDSFWRDKAVAMMTTRPVSIQEDYVTGPGLWERYREFIKEKHYE
jgi:anti-sigma factor RsiW